MQRTRFSAITSRRAGFTLIEMLVVVGVIATLLALLLAGLQAAGRTSRKTGQLNDLRQTYIAWAAYAGSYGDYLLPGRLDVATQGQWRVNYRYRTGGDIPAGYCVHYPFRLMAYLDWNFSSLYGYYPDFDAWYPPTNAGEPGIAESTDRVAHHPAFGYNGFYLGGSWTTDASGNTLMQFANGEWRMGRGGTDTTGIAVRGKLVARTLGNITQPSEKVTFCSSIHRNPGIYKLSSEFSPGSDMVVPHIFAETEIWAPYIGLTGEVDPTSLLSAARTLGATRTLGASAAPMRMEVFESASVPYNRFDSSIAVLHADGNTTNIALTNLLDQSKWINCALDGLGRPSTFSHTPGP